MKRYIAEMMNTYLARPLSPWHMPGHKRKRTFGGMWDEMFGLDLTEVPGTDDYHHPAGAIYDSERAAAEVYGAAYSHYLVGGSTAGILAGVLALSEMYKKEYGEKAVFLTARNVHRSVRNALRLAGAEYIELRPEGDEDYGPIMPEEVRRALEKNIAEVKCSADTKSHIAGCILTSPAYAGTVSPLREIHDILKEAGIPLLVDEAHGAHFPFASELSAFSGISCGAEIVVQSLHKTLPALTQTAIMHLAGRDEGGWYEPELLEKCIKDKLSVIQSSSPSYILLSSAEQAVAWADENRAVFDLYIERIRNFRTSLGNGIGDFRLKEYGTMQDPTRITMEAGNIYPVRAAQQLEDQYGIIAELAGKKELIFISTVADTEADLNILKEGLAGIKSCDQGMQEKLKNITLTDQSTRDLKHFRIPEAGSEAERDIYVYPPGILIAGRGDTLTEKMILRIREELSYGRRVWGLDQTESSENPCG